jgi:hypothetical protein
MSNDGNCDQHKNHARNIAQRMPEPITNSVCGRELHAGPSASRLAIILAINSFRYLLATSTQVRLFPKILCLIIASTLFCAHLEACRAPFPK